MSGKFFLRCLVVTSLALAACGEDDEDPVTPTPDAGGGDPCQGLTYDNFAEDLLVANKCMVCHSATPAGNTLSLDTKAKVQAAAQGIIAHAIEPREMPVMPQGFPAIPAADQVKLKTWLECGAP